MPSRSCDASSRSRVPTSRSEMIEQEDRVRNILPILVLLQPGVPTESRHVVSFASQGQERHLFLCQRQLHIETEGWSDEQSGQVDQLRQVRTARHEGDELLVFDGADADPKAALDVPYALADDRGDAQLRE